MIETALKKRSSDIVYFSILNIGIRAWRRLVWKGAYETVLNFFLPGFPLVPFPPISPFKAL